MLRQSPRAGAVLLLACAVALGGVPASGDPLETPAGTTSVPLETPPAAAAVEPAPPPPADDYDPLFDDEEDDPQASVNDPIEETNRKVLDFNDGVDRYFWSPISRGVRAVVPDPALTALGNAIWNLDSPSVLVNDLLQGRPGLAARTFARMVLNTIVGLGGLMDPAAAVGLERREADFGQTLGVYGVGPGPYLIVPFVGPATVRDGFGGVVDSLMNPLTYVIGPGGSLVLGVVFLNFGRGVAMQERHRVELEAVRESSVDYYSALRSIYVQSRDAAIQEVKDHHAAAAMARREGALEAPRIAALERTPRGPSKLRRHRSR